MAERLNIAGPKYEIDVGSMSPDVQQAYFSALERADALALGNDVDAAREVYAEIDRLEQPYKRERKPPRPTAADPPPPELIPDDKQAIAVCLSPDVCKSPEKPVPFCVYGTADNDENYSQNVRANGKIIKRQDSKFTRTFGDEPGVGLGVKSGTVGDVVEPVTSSPIVCANGVPIQRHADRCTLNNGNTEGEYCYVKSTETKSAPDATDNQNKSIMGDFWAGMKATSDEASMVDGAYNKISDWYNGKASISGDIESFYNDLPTGADIWQGTKNIGSGIGHVGGQVVSDPIGSAKAVGGYARDSVTEAIDSVEAGYEKHGVSGAFGAGTGVLAGIVSPGKKLKLLKEAGEALEEAGDLGKALKKGEEQLAKNEKSPPAANAGDGGARVTDTKKRTRNPCAHLAKGNPDGKGPYRGGSYDGTRGAGDDRESDHMPPKSVSPMGEGRSPAISMYKPDHRKARSTGSGKRAEQWRADQQKLIDAGRYRDATAMDYHDRRRLARQAGEPRRYNEAMLERSAYQRCLEKHGLLPGKKKG